MDCAGEIAAGRLPTTSRILCTGLPPDPERVYAEGEEGEPGPGDEPGDLLIVPLAGGGLGVFVVGDDEKGEEC